MRKVFRIITVVGFLSLGGMVFNSCSLDSEQSNYKDDSSPISTTDELISTVNGAYAQMTSSTYYGRDVIIYSEARSPYAFSSDRTGRFGNVSGFDLQVSHAYPKDTWLQIYRVITNANKVIEATLEDNQKNGYYKGQAYIIRALGHYDLVRIYGEQYVNDGGVNALGVPYKTKSHDADELITRPTVKENMDAIFNDLDRGIELLLKGREGGLEGNSLVKEKINYVAALGLKSRIALFFSQYDKSKLEVVVDAASKAIKEKGAIDVLPRAGYMDGYKSDGVMPNSLFELAQSGTDNQFTASLQYIYNRGTSGGYGDVQWKFDKVTAVFDPKDGEDIRAEVITADKPDNVLRNTGKYVSRSSNIRMIRIEEVMLNYAEATLNGASNGDQAVALAYVNDIESNRVLINDAPKKLTSLSMDVLRNIRMKELMFEGFGFEDAMRWRQSISNPKISVNTRITGDAIEYGNGLLTFPIPESETNVSRIEQNQAYK